MRRIREALGASQEQVARLAGVSQGAVSRLEGGRALLTPLIVVLKITLALKRAVEEKDAASMSPERNILRATHERIQPNLDEKGEFRSFPVLADPQLEELVRLFHAMPSRQKTLLVDVLSAVAAALS